VEIFYSLQEAKEGGEIEELCTVTEKISGYAGSGWAENVAYAMTKVEPRICECGADKAYSLDLDYKLSGGGYHQDATPRPSISVTLVGFRFVEKK